MKALVLLSASGSVCLILILLLQKVFRKFKLYTWQDLLIKMMLFLFLIPCPFGAVEKFLWEKACEKPAANGETDLFIRSNKGSVLLYDHGIDANKCFRIYLIVTAAVMSVMLLLLFVKIYRYLQAKRQFMPSESCAETDIRPEELEELKKCAGFTKDVPIYMLPYLGSAMVMGYFRPAILLPQKLGKEQRDIAILHEMYHMKRRDIFYKYLIMAVVCIHWFNPLVYCLPELFNRNCELNCDGMVIRHLSMKQRKIYANEILSQIESGQKSGDIFLGLGGSKGMTKERIQYIMNGKRKSSSTGLKIMMGVLTVGILAVSSVPVSAYDGVEILNIEGSEEFIQEECGIFYDSDILFTASEERFIVEPEYTEIRFDKQFTDEDGNIYDAESHENAREACTHPNLVSGTYQTHTKNSTGGCVVKIYEAQRCTDCGKVIVGSLISETKYTKCTH